MDLRRKNMRTTITINDKLFRALKIRAAETDETVSSIVEDAVKYRLLEDLEDIGIAKTRQNEPTLSFESLVTTLKAEGLL
jgi:predicted transcriptional regulator